MSTPKRLGQSISLTILITMSKVTYMKGELINGRISPQNWRITTPDGQWQNDNLQDVAVMAGLKSADGVGKLSANQVYEKVSRLGGTLTGRFECGALFEATGEGYYIITRSSRGEAPKVEEAPAPTPKSNGLESAIIDAIAPFIKPSLDEGRVKEIVQGMMEGREIRTLEIKYGKSTKKVDGQHENFDKLVRAVGIGKNVMLVGEAGSGKTYGAVQCAKALSLDYYIQSFSNQTSKFDLIGMTTAMGEYVSTPTRDAFENGGVLILDEMDAANPNVILALNNMLSGDEYLFPNGMVKKHDDFKVIACMNTFGYGASKEYGGRNRQDAALLNRWVKISWNYDLVLERQIAGDTKVTQIVQDIRANAKRFAMNLVISPRQSIDANDLVEAGFTIDEALSMTIFEGLANDQIKSLKDGVTI
jgi:MoxR-like ATPase